MERIIGDYGPKDGHTLILVMAAVHGNETGGVVALERVFKFLKEHQPSFDGRLVGIRGNLKAIRKKQRYIEEDLNRLWAEEFIHIACTHEHDHPEFEELAEIFRTFDEIGFDQYRQKIFVDLHGTSADNGIFLIVGDLNEASFLVEPLHAPVLLGLHEELHNTTVPYMNRNGFLAFGFEGGKIGDKQTIDNHETILWQILEHAHVVRTGAIPENLRRSRVLDEFSTSLPGTLHVDYCHKIKEGDNFKMMPGFKNFDWIKKGDLLAYDRHGEIRSQHNGYMLMPLYQSEGNDGFFLVSPQHQHA